MTRFNVKFSEKARRFSVGFFDGTKEFPVSLGAHTEIVAGNDCQAATLGMIDAAIDEAFENKEE